MEEASFMEHVKTAPSNDELFSNPIMEDDDDDDDSFVPESLRGFLQDANAKLDADLNDILGNATESIMNNASTKQTHWIEEEEDMDEDPPPPVMPEMEEVQIPWNPTTDTSITTRSSMKRREDRLKNDEQQSQEEEDKYSIPNGQSEEEEPILAKLEQMELESIPITLSQNKPYPELTTRDMLQPKAIPDPDALVSEDSSNDQFFQEILKQEEDLSLKHSLMMGLLDDDQARVKQFAAAQRQAQQLEDAKERERLKELQRKQEQHYYEEDSSIPPLESMNAPIIHRPDESSNKDDTNDAILESKIFEEDEDDIMLEELLGDGDAGALNPAAFLTAGQAKDMALDGVLPPALEPDSDDEAPVQRDLSAALLQAEQEFGTEVANNNIKVPQPMETTKNPSPPKRPKLEGMDAILAEEDDFDQMELKMAHLDDEKERSYISSSSDDEKPSKPLSPPSIVHQTDTPPSLQDVKQTLVPFHLQDTSGTTNKNRLQPPMPELLATAPPQRPEDNDLHTKSKKQPAPVAANPTERQPEDATRSKLLEFLHSNINENKSSDSKKVPEVVKPLFSAKETTTEDIREAIVPLPKETRTAPVKMPTNEKDGGTPPKLPLTHSMMRFLTKPAPSSTKAPDVSSSSASLPPETNRTTPVKKKPSARNRTPPKPPKTPDHHQTPPSVKENPPSPVGAVDNLFDYLHPTVEMNSKRPSKQPVQRKQLFSGPPTVEPKRRPATEVTIPPAASPTMSRTIPNNAFSPTSSIGFGSPTSELRMKRQMVQEQQSSIAGSPMSMTSARRQGHSPLVNKKFPPRELTSPDKNIPSRLLQGTAATRAATRAKHGTNRKMETASIKTMATTRTATKSADPTGSNRFMQPTQASRRLTTSRIKPTVESTSPPKQRKAPTTLSRFMQPTQASQKQKSTVPAKTETLVDQKATRARVRERMATSRRTATQINREKKAEQKRNIKSTMDRVRERRERMARMEQERVAKLKAKIAEREKKREERKAKMGAERTSPVKAAAKTRTNRAAKSAIPRPLTVPKAPNFLTDKRLKRQTPPRREEMVPLANADSVFMRSFRDDQSMGSAATGERKLTIPKTPMLATKHRGEPREKPKEEMVPLAAADTVLIRSFRDDQSMGGGSTAQERRLTIPKTPNLVTTKKYGDKSATRQTTDEDEGSVHQWQDGLRTATSPSNKSVCSQLTIPQTPNFQPSRKREPVQSTAEREQAEMDYYKAHPFKAKPVGSGIKHVSSTAKKQVEKRKLTVPKPFRLSAGRRTTPSHEPRRESSGQPKTLFPAPRGTPVEGFTMRAKRSTTTPQPFQLSSSRRKSFSPTESTDGPGPPKNIAVKSTNEFHARPMPKFDSVSIPVRGKDPSKLRSPPAKKPEEVKRFKARGIPKSLSQPSIPVRQKDPSKLRSPDYVKTSPEYLRRHGKKVERKMVSPKSSESKPFRAKPAPRRSPPDIPVRSRDHRKLRPVAKKTVPSRPSLPGSSFSSNISSSESRVNQRKATRENMRQRMKGRRGKAVSGSVTTTDSSQVGPSLDTTVTTSSDGVSSSYGESGLSSSHEESGLSTSCTESIASPNAAREKSLLQVAMEKRANGGASLTVTSNAEQEASTPVTKGGKSNKEELRNAMGGWMFDSVPATAASAGLVKAHSKSVPKIGGDRMSEIRRTEPDPLEMARIAEEKRKQEEDSRKQNRSKTYEETTQMAAHLQKQLEDALSFEATYRAGDDLDHGYIGEPTDGLGRFEL